MNDIHTCNENCIPLPLKVQQLKTAQEVVLGHWSKTKLKFTLDGRLLGDIAEAIVAENFDLRFPHELEPKKGRTKGVDLWMPNGQENVQVKCSAIGKGPAYSSGEEHADFLLFGLIRFKTGCFEIVYNGPESPVREPLGKITGTKRIPLKQIIEQDKEQQKLQATRLARI